MREVMTMILYFSGTGNSKWAASLVANGLHDQAYDITQLNDGLKVENETYLGFIFPIYAWGVPELMLQFIKRLPKSPAYTFAIATCGEEAGKALKKLDKIYPLQASFSIVMPNNYVIGSELEDENTCIKKINAARKTLQQIIKDIIDQKSVYKVEEGSFASLKSSIVNYGFNKYARSTKPFYATDICNGCGICKKNCPAHTIEIINLKPQWNKTCYQCLRCIHECPKHAIEYGEKTKNRKRYTLKSYIK